MLTGIPTKEAKTEIKTHQVSAEANLFKTIQTFCTFYSSNHFGLFFLQ